MLRAVADTHAIIWYLYDDLRLSTLARATFEDAATDGDQIGFSTITLAEIVYLSEKGRVQPRIFERLLSALSQPGTVLRDLPFDRAVAGVLPSVDRSKVPDFPDRLIAAIAQLYGVPLISRDRKIQLSGLPTLW